MFLFRLAKDLKRLVCEIEADMPAYEFMCWAEYYAAEARAQVKAQRKAEAAAKRRRR